MRHLPTLTAVAVWLAMAALLVARQTPAPGLDATGLAAAPVEAAGGRDEWFGLYQGVHKIGHTRRQTTRTDDGWRFRDESTFVLAMLGTPQRVTTTLDAETDAAFALRRFRFVLTSPAATFAATGESDGRTLEARYGAEGRGETLTLPLAEPIHLPGMLRPRIAAASPAPGTRYAHEVLSPMTLRNEPVSTLVEAREELDGRSVLRLVEEHQGMKARVWVADDGSVVREEAQMGFQLRAEPRAQALAGIDDAAPLDIAVSTRIPLRGTVAAPRERARLVLRVTGEAASRIPQAPPRQRMAAGVLTVVREPPPAEGAPADVPEVVRPWLAASPFIESDHPTIVARARSIVGEETDAVRQAARLVGWVHTRMTPEPTMTVPSAREVLRTMRGDCNEHAVLLAALARAAGIPARVAAGAVYLDDGFYYHAWTELWLSGRWISADAVFDQMPADATHVKLLDGGPERHLELAQVVGRLAFISVDDVTPAGEGAS
ncbi:MAG: transglutaminase domain-containing protein [bacterium]|nr:transglutaminase domain-containing protein [bacterium]